MTLELTGREALSEFLFWLAIELRRGSIDRVSLEMAEGKTRVSIVLTDDPLDWQYESTKPGTSPAPECKEPGDEPGSE